MPIRVPPTDGPAAGATGGRAAITAHGRRRHHDTACSRCRGWRATKAPTPPRRRPRMPCAPCWQPSGTSSPERNRWSSPPGCRTRPRPSSPPRSLPPNPSPAGASSGPGGPHRRQPGNYPLRHRHCPAHRAPARRRGPPLPHPHPTPPGYGLLSGPVELTQATRHASSRQTAHGGGTPAAKGVPTAAHGETLPPQRRGAAGLAGPPPSAGEPRTMPRPAGGYR